MKKLKIATIILTVILISLISFAGVYIQVQNRMENQVKDYKLGMNLSGYRQVKIKPAEGETEESNPEVTDADVNLAKEILEKRLKQFGAEQYFVRAHKGNIVIEMAEQDGIDDIIANVVQQGKFEMLDSVTNEVLMTNSDIKLVNVLYGSTETGTSVYLNIEFTEEGAEKFTELTTKYKTVEESEEDESTEGEQAENAGIEENAEESTTTEEGEDSEENTQAKVSLQIDGNELVSQNFDEPITNGKIQLAFSSATTSNSVLQQNIQTATTLAILLDNGMLPVEYEVEENSYIYSDITNQMLMIFSIAIAIITVIALIVLIVKYKVRGLVASVLYVGLIALYLLIIRYTNVELTIEGIAGILVLLVINYIITLRIIKNENIIQEDLIPIIIVTVAFCFTRWAELTSFGMVMFWGLVTLVYHMITKKLLED